jgi:hypothetical protein
MMRIFCVTLTASKSAHSIMRLEQKWCKGHNRDTGSLKFGNRILFKTADHSWETSVRGFYKLLPSESSPVQVQWLGLAWSKGPIWVGVSPPITWRRKKNQLPKRRGFIFLYFIQDDGQSPKDNWFSTSESSSLNFDPVQLYNSVILVVSFIAVLSLIVAADAGSLCDKAKALGEIIKETSFIFSLLHIPECFVVLIPCLRLANRCY